MISVVCIFGGLLSLISEVPDLVFLPFFMCVFFFKVSNWVFPYR